MQVYLVGGAVRDEQLGLPLGERDWCVVGASPDELIELGYRQVGKDFPVFLHPETGEEYALARTERKTAPGYHGFAFDFCGIEIDPDSGRVELVNITCSDDVGTIINPMIVAGQLHGGLAHGIGQALLDSLGDRERFGVEFVVQSSGVVVDMTKRRPQIV